MKFAVIRDEHAMKNTILQPDYNYLFELDA